MDITKLKFWFIVFAMVCVFIMETVKAGDIESQAQLEINKTTLLAESSSEKNRVNAAVLLLLSQESQARQVLLEALSDVNSPIPRTAVCKAIKQSMAWDDSVKNKKDFRKPLILLLGADSQESALAAEALLIFNYKDLSKQLKTIVYDENESIDRRLGALYAIKVRPDKEAVLDLISLVNSKNEQISQSAKQFLEKLLGVPADVDRGEWDRISAELKKKSRSEFIADRLAVQHDKIKLLEDQLGQWKSLYIASLDKLYEQMVDESKESFLLDQLANDENDIKIWSLERVLEWIKSGRPVPADISDKVLGLVDNGNRDVRLKSAKLLGSLGYAGPAEGLLKQMKAEKDSVVRFEQFKSLGEAIYYALSPGSNVEVNDGIRLETLQIAGKYLDVNESERVVAGARVIRKLLDQNGLDVSIAEAYLKMLYDKYAKMDISSVEVRAEILTVMNRLCQESSAYRVVASNLFKSLFEKGLADEFSGIRLASIEGLANIDKAEAVQRVRELELYNDKQESVQFLVITLAEAAGGIDDLPWLVNKISINDSLEASWNALSGILSRQKIDVVERWASKIVNIGSSSENYYQFILGLEKRFLQENVELPLYLKLELIKYYKSEGNIDNAVKYLEETVVISSDISRINELIGLYLNNKDFGKAGDLLAAYLNGKNIDANMPILKLISSYFKDVEVEIDDKKAFLGVLADADIASGAVWAELFKSWQEIVEAKVEKSEQKNATVDLL